MRVVWKVALIYRSFAPLDQLVSAGNEIMVSSLRRYDPNKGHFEAFLKESIRLGLIRIIRREKDAVTVGTTVYEALDKITKSSHVLGREISDQELAQVTGISLRNIKICRSIHTRGVPVSDDIEYNHELSLSVPDDSDIINVLCVVTPNIETCLPKLTVVEQQAIKLRLGLGTNTPLSVTRIAAKLQRKFGGQGAGKRKNYSKQAVAQFILPRALRKLRCYLEVVSITPAIWAKLHYLHLVPKNNVSPTVAEIVSTIKELYTIDEWIYTANGRNRRLDTQVKLCGIVKVATILGLSGDPIKEKAVFLQIGMIVWGNDEFMKHLNQYLLSRKLKRKKKK